MPTIDGDSLVLERYDEIIDVRAPQEYEDDHIPGAINLPVLDDEQRAVVGTMHKQVSAFEARKHGAALVSRNIAHHLETHFKDKSPSYQPLVYCWRGGQRSGSMSHVLAQVGWNVTRLEKGYKSYRHRVMRELETLPLGFEFRVLAGLTGSGKTEILKELEAKGEQVLDLEGLANHMGSLLGAPVAGQNMSQKRFESRLWEALGKLDPKRPVWSEAESAKIGQVYCPKVLLEKVRSGVKIEVRAPMSERVRFLNDRYDHWHEAPETLLGKLGWLKKRHGGEELSLWATLVEEKRWDEFVERVLTVHYDPSYRSANDGALEKAAHVIDVSDLMGEGRAAAASELIARFR